MDLKFRFYVTIYIFNLSGLKASVRVRISGHYCFSLIFLTLDRGIRTILGKRIVGKQEKILEIAKGPIGVCKDL